MSGPTSSYAVRLKQINRGILAARAWRDVTTLLASVPGECLDVTGEVLVRASIAAAMVPMVLPSIGNGSLSPRFSAIVFELEPPSAAQGAPGVKTPFKGMAIPSDGGVGTLLIFAEHRSGISGLGDAVGPILGALSSYCEVHGE